VDRNLERLKWRSRRGLLELDLVFEKFWAREIALSDGDIAAMERLLTMPDNDLLDLVMGRSETRDPEIRAIVEKLRAAQKNSKER
jgi:succinate dehydrogenase flavin-adding protein (antitoxin of CptAB toxin-antitoxin module)